MSPHSIDAVTFGQIGGGSGRCARDILDFIKKEAPKVYQTMQYRIVEISKALAEKQTARVESGSTHASRFEVRNHDASRREGWGPAKKHPCFIIMLEVADNLPHDRVCISGDDLSHWKETHVVQGIDLDGNDVVKEELQPLQDPLILRCMEALGYHADTRTSWMSKQLNRAMGTTSFQFVPTRCLAVLETLHLARPNHKLVLADFDYLPDVVIPGHMAPLVASVSEGSTKDHGTYLLPRGTADIFYPTDFEALQKLNAKAAQQQVAFGKSTEKIPKRGSSQVLTTKEFMLTYGELGGTQTLGGFNPLLDDFTNTKFFLS
ncbi:hypothetical protein CYMTET_56888 [Cymbomonas tetramitiformis]|uniref:Protein arginine methyltransferase NDUFAF7 n=1 Tax=Cymbomonas tetramitiformis TaxID=36881 RepID=A0AAE0BA05_9CHLO|nr:hypothetical protein CYMTET_56888 [Cymbomonas tetramitiformis]